MKKHKELFSDSAYESRLRGKSKFDAAMVEEMVSDHRSVTAQKIANDIKVIDSYDQDIKNLRGWRNKALAHIDEDLVHKGVTVDQAYPLLRSRITEAVDAFGNIFNFYSVAYDSKEYIFGVPFASGLQTIITALAEWRQLRRERTMRGS
jgi:chromatin segregation and condensation protein Rec8/ScpA/Scc1 (kleisin family)